MARDKAIALLQQYADEVRKEGLLAKAAAKKEPHAVQIKFPKDTLAYIGAAKCAAWSLNIVA